MEQQLQAWVGQVHREVRAQLEVETVRKHQRQWEGGYGEGLGMKCGCR